MEPVLQCCNINDIKYYVKTLADTIIWVAQERQGCEPCQDINSSIHSVVLDMKQYLMDFMAKSKSKKV